MQLDSSTADQAAADMGSLIPEYRSTLARMKRQVDELHSKLEDACQQRDALQQQVEPCIATLLMFVRLVSSITKSSFLMARSKDLCKLLCQLVKKHVYVT